MRMICIKYQWCNSWGGQGAPWHFSPGNFWWPSGKREARKKGRMEKKRRKINKGKVENWKWKEEHYKMKRDPFFFFSLFKATEICFGSTKLGIFPTGKNHFTLGKKSGKMTLPPLKNIPVICPCKQAFLWLQLVALLLTLMGVQWKGLVRVWTEKVNLKLFVSNH